MNGWQDILAYFLGWKSSATPPISIERITNVDCVYTPHISLDCVYTQHISLESVYIQHISLDSTY